MVGVPDHLTWNQRQAVGINQKVIQIIDQELSILLLDLDVCVIRVGPDRNRVSAGSIADGVVFFDRSCYHFGARLETCERDHRLEVEFFGLEDLGRYLFGFRVDFAVARSFQPGIGVLRPLLQTDKCPIPGEVVFDVFDTRFHHAFTFGIRFATNINI